MTHNAAQHDNTTILRLSYASSDGLLSRLDMHYLLGDSSGIRYLSDVHELTLFTEDEYLQALTAAGLVGVGTAPGWAEHRPRILGVAAEPVATSEPPRSP